MKKLDHGIIGAYILYSELVENYLKKYEESGADDINYLRVSEVVFCSELFSIYAYIADCIGAHNIFMADIKYRSIYQQYGLEALLPEKFEKIFAFSLIDEMWFDLGKGLHNLFGIKNNNGIVNQRKSHSLLTL